MTAHIDQPPFLRVPAEIRLMVYKLLLDDGGVKTFEIDSQRPGAYADRVTTRGKPLRTEYNVLGPWMQRRSRPTTYLLNPLHPANIYPAILATSHKIHEEASVLLYGNRTFDFGGDTAALVHFLQDLSPRTRILIQEISMVKISDFYALCSDRCAWKEACSSIAQHLRLQKLTLIINGGIRRPVFEWDGKTAFTDFERILETEEMDWVRHLLVIKGLRELKVTQNLEDCPMPMSHSASFSAASIEKGLIEYLRSQMLTATAA